MLKTTSMEPRDRLLLSVTRSVTIGGNKA